MAMVDPNWGAQSMGYQDEDGVNAIEAERLEAIKKAVRDVTGRLVFYPCAGDDYQEPLSLFAPYFSWFQFEDINYDFTNACSALIWSDHFDLDSCQLHGLPSCCLRNVRDASGNQYREIDPAILSETYSEISTSRTLTVIRRRGFGQYGMALLEPESVGVFIHRGDSGSRGEGGSGAFFLANRRASHEPLSKLFNKLKRVLSPVSLIVTDGSNSNIPWLCRTYGERNVATDLHSHGEVFEGYGCHWTCVCRIGDTRHGQTYIWKVKQFT